MRHELAGQAYIDQVKRRGVKAEGVHRQKFSEFTQYTVSDKIGVFRSKNDIIEKDVFETECNKGNQENHNDATDEDAPEFIQVFPEGHFPIPAFGFFSHLYFTANKYKDKMVVGISKKGLSCML